MNKRISILGSTGSIGENTINVLDHLGEGYTIVALSANRNWKRLVEQARALNPETICLADETHIDQLKAALAGLDVEILSGRSGVLELAERTNCDILLNALVGSPGMEPTYRAVSAGVNVALSNKESLVMAGSIITETAKKNDAAIFPVDSEHSAIWQCLVGESLDQVKRIVLTGSGGPFRTRDLSTFTTIQPEEALKHPNWDMGQKITIDSATMMNKGLEVIEAKWLFQMETEDIDIVVHPQSIIHSMVEFVDSSVKAQLGVPDMKVPIQYALTYPDHIDADWEQLDLSAIGTLTFEKPDMNRFPCIQLAYDVLKAGGSTAAVLNTANDHVVDMFLKRQIGFMDIPRLIEETISKHEFVEYPTMDDLLALEKWTSDILKRGEIK